MTTERQRLRIGSVQYFIRPVKDFAEFADQVEGLFATAADYRVQLLVFPEYFTVQLLTLGNVKRPIAEQVRDLAQQVPRFQKLVGDLAVRHQVHVVAGSIPNLDEATGSGGTGELYNDCFIFGPNGKMASQGKIHLTRWEREEWKIRPRRRLHVFEAPFGRFAVSICYDAEFPELARAAARKGADLLIVPSCTDDRQGFLRVRYCAQARAIENQMYVVHSCTVGSLPMVPAVSHNYGQASVLTPSDFAFSRDGIRAEGTVNQEMIVIGDVDIEELRRSRETGTVIPLRDSATTAEVLADLEEVAL